LEKKLDESESNKNISIFAQLAENNSPSGQVKQKQFRAMEGEKRNHSKSGNGISHNISANTKQKSGATNGHSQKESQKPGNGVAVAKKNADKNYEYGVEVGPYANLHDASQTANAFKERGYQTQIAPSNKTESGAKQYVLTIGGFKQRDKAVKLSEMMTTKSSIPNKVIRYKKQ
jgi:cell division septation protein DedD